MTSTALNPHPPTPRSPWEDTRTWLMLAWLLGVWWMSTQFCGSTLRDGKLYAIEALRLLEPHNFAGDVFFAGQSQGKLSLFTTLYAPVVAGLGLKIGGMVVAFAGRMLWGTALVLLARRLWPGPATAWLPGLALMLLLPASYDSYGMFAYGEPESTARSWAEALVLLALGQQWAGRPLRAAGLVLLSAALHPIMALPGASLLLLLQRPRVRHLGIGLGLAAILAGAALQIGPLGRLFQQFDDAWWVSIQRITGYIFHTQWQLLALLKAAGLGALLLHVSLCAPQPALRRLARRLLGLQVVMLGLWWLGDATRNVLLVQLQCWRVLWLCQLLAPALWFSTLAPWRQWDARQWSQVGLVATGLVSVGTYTGWITAPALLLSHPLAARLFQQQPLLRRLIPTLALLMLAGTLFVRLPVYQYQIGLNDLYQLIQPEAMTTAGEPMFTLPLTVGLMMALLRAQRAGARRLLGWLALIPLGLSLNIFSIQLERALKPFPDAHALQALIPEGSVVYWDMGVQHAWFSLHRAHYAGRNQGTTALFSREAAIEFRRRFTQLEQARLEEKLIPDDHAVPDNNANTIDLQHLRQLCQDPILDFVLLSLDVVEADAHIPYADAPGGMTSVFRCSPLRSTKSSPLPRPATTAASAIR